MDREILFRGKRADNGEWVYGYFVKYQPSANEDKWVVGIVPDYASALYLIEVDNETISRYAGLTDKNGVKIFEGDQCIVTRVGTLAYGVITFCQGCFVFKENDTGNLLRLCDVEINGYKIRVQGNIHDNPELPKGEPND